MSNTFPKATAQDGMQQVMPNPSFPDLEVSILKYWDQDDTFQKSVEQRPSGDHSGNEFVFFDGPPFANGLPHYGHLLTGYAKDVIPRYQTMKGRKVNRVFGWDTHGLPAELEAQKELGIDSVEQIEEMGIDKFNDACRTSVLKYTNEWQDYVHRQARWVDFEHGYKTLNIPYMESVMWAFKQLYDKGLAYQGYRVLPYCPKDQTPLSAHELRMEVLLELHGEDELDYVDDYADMVGVNNRHLGTFHTDVEHSFRLASRLPKDKVLVSESGISQPQTVRSLREAGFRGFLMGEAFMKTDNPGAALSGFIKQLRP